jgi:uncharacterized protein
MEQGIPKQIKLYKFASKGLFFSHKYQLRDFPRISKIASNLDDSVEVELSIKLENNNIPCIIGEIKLDVTLTCQRCLDDVVISLKPNFKLAFLQNEEQGNELDSVYETVLNKNDEFSTIEFITDEVLISIPMIPMHSHECSTYMDIQPLKEQKQESPFAILKHTKQTNRSK